MLTSCYSVAEVSDIKIATRNACSVIFLLALLVLTALLAGGQGQPVSAKCDLTMAVSPGGGGTTTPAIGRHAYDKGVDVSVSATANTGYRFDHWQGGLTGSTNPTKVTMNANLSVTAVFVEQGLVIGNVAITTDSKFYKDRAGDPIKKEIMDVMMKSASKYAFPKEADFVSEVEFRKAIIEGMRKLKSSNVSFLDVDMKADSTYWKGEKHTPTATGADTKLTLTAAGKLDPAKAIKALMSDKTEVECMTGMMIVYWWALLKVRGDAEFNKIYGKTAITLDKVSALVASWVNRAVDGKDIIPGDWVYFYNFQSREWDPVARKWKYEKDDYVKVRSGGSFQGENAIYLGGGTGKGDGKYAGHGVTGELTAEELRKKLLKAYNEGPPGNPLAGNKKKKLKDIPKPEMMFGGRLP